MSTCRKPRRRRLPSASPSAAHRTRGRRSAVTGGLAVLAVLAGLLAVHSPSWATGLDTALTVAAACGAFTARRPR
ncbi:hypothetical protein [Paractinoplanes hotanensis]|uniref:Uncharacterized protein n=1 Tax=Paractinoplanes hotanensis TaxID=2906497 RepID=A0ABT0Y879_9ACTN|nr:hypothetical protein [Actinoplanes hotanensis]MCM4082251.1 hypothetical protein [Actinoplanes hotanensis]